MNVMTEQTLTEPLDQRQELSRGFSRYQSILVALLALVQFTIIIDFMIMSPLGAIIMPALNISAAQFGVAVSAYAFSAGISGILAAGFADRFDRKWLLLFFYVGFTLGTALCADPAGSNPPYELNRRTASSRALNCLSSHRHNAEPE